MVASSTTDAVPAWSTPVLVVAFVVLVGTTVALFIAKDVANERRIYWSGFCLAAVLVAISVLHRGWGTALATFIAVVFVAALYAFLRTDYLKIGQKIYSVGSLTGRNR